MISLDILSSPSVFSKDGGKVCVLPLAFVETSIPFFVKSLARYYSRHRDGVWCTAAEWYPWMIDLLLGGWR